MAVLAAASLPAALLLLLLLAPVCTGATTTTPTTTAPTTTQAPLNGPCTATRDCSNDNAECSSSTCRCRAGYFDSNGVCAAASSVAPANLQVTRGVGSLTLAWSAPSLGSSSASVSGYLIQWTGGGGGNTDAGAYLSHHITGLSPNVQYTFQVVARISYNGRTETSGSSNTVTGKPLSTEDEACSVDGDCGTDTNLVCEAMVCRCRSGYFWRSDRSVCVAASSVAPASLRVTARGVGSLTLAWSAPSLGSSASVSGYLIQQTGGGGGDTSVGTSLTGQVTGLSPNVQYTFQVKARISYNGRTETSGSSNNVTGKPLSTEGEACSVDGDCGNNTNLVCDMTAQVCRCRSGYFWRSNSSVCIAASSVAPGNLQVTRGVGSLTLTWSALSLGSSASVSGYLIQQTGGGNISVGTSLSHNITGLTPNVNYTFHVVARISYNNRTETSSSSNTVTGKPLSTESQACSGNEDCGPDTNLVCEAAKGCRCPSGYFWRSDSSACVLASSVAPASLQMTARGVGSLTLAWSAPSLGSSSASVSGYLIQWTGGGGGNIDAGAYLSHHITGLSPNVQYTFQVVARISYNGRTETSGSSNNVTSKPQSAEGGACSGPGDCGTTTDFVCDNKTCRCKSSYFWNSDRQTCVHATSVRPDSPRVTSPEGITVLSWASLSLGSGTSVIGYQIQWPNGTVIGTTASPPFAVFNLSPQVHYSFQVVARISYNNKMETSGSAVVTGKSLYVENEACWVSSDCDSAPSQTCNPCHCRGTYVWSGTGSVCVTASTVTLDAATTQVSSPATDLRLKTGAEKQDSTVVIILAVLCLVLGLALLVTNLYHFRQRRRGERARDPTYAQTAAVPAAEEAHVYTELGSFSHQAASRRAAK